MAEEAVYHVLVAAPLPLILSVLAFRVHALAIRAMLLAASVLLFVALYVLTYFFFCVGCT